MKKNKKSTVGIKGPLISLLVFIGLYIITASTDFFSVITFLAAIITLAISVKAIKEGHLIVGLSVAILVSLYILMIVVSVILVAFFLLMG